MRLIDGRKGDKTCRTDQRLPAMVSRINLPYRCVYPDELEVSYSCKLLAGRACSKINYPWKRGNHSLRETAFCQVP